MKRFPYRRSRVAALAVTLLCAAVVCVAAVDPFIDDLQPAAAPQQQPVLSRATPTPPSTRPPVPPPPKPEPPKPLQSPPPAPAPAQPPAPPKPAAAPTPAAASPGTPKPGEPAIPHAKGAAQAAAVPVPVATAPAKPVVSSSAVNITAVPTAAPAPVKRGEAVETKKHGAAALFDVKVKGTHVAISPSGDVMVRNPDLDINTMRVVQMIAGVVQAVKRVVEASKPAPSKEHADVEARNKARVRAESETDDDEEDAGEEKGDAAAPPSPPAPVIVKQKVTIVTGGGDADGVEAAGRMQPLPAELIGDETDLSPRRFGRHSDLVDDAKPYARKLHYRVRRSYTPGTSSVGDVRFDGFAPITMQLQQVSTIPSSEFAPDSYRFAVDVPGQPTFYLDLPRNA